MNNFQQHDNHRERLERWVRDHGPAVRGYLLAMTARHDVADDLLQEVLRKAWQARDNYKETGQGRAYLMRIADRLVIDRARRGGREVHLEPPAWQEVENEGVRRQGASQSPDANLRRTEAQQQLQAALKQLTAPQQRVLLLRYYGELSFAEIAESTGLPLGTALSHARRGLLALREAMTESPR